MIWEAEFAAPVLAAIGGKLTPTTSLNLFGWSAQEKAGLHPAPTSFDWWQWCNPLNTTEPWPGAVDSGAQPGPHDVKIYRSLADGCAATVATLLNGQYDTIVQSLRENLPASWWSETARNELGTWGTGAGWCDFVPLGADVMAQLEDIQQFVDRGFNLLKVGKDWSHTGADGIPVPGASGDGSPPYLQAELDAISAKLDVTSSKLDQLISALIQTPSSPVGQDVLPTPPSSA